MCGIAGAVGRVDARIEAGVMRAHGAQVHRGPDAQGVWLEFGTSERARVLFAHRRLAILDLSADGEQPMQDHAHERVIVFNGEIYNFRELRTHLAGLGASFHTQSDTEVLLAAYAQWGERCVDHLRGMFAFALYDAAKRCVFFARDRLGEKPLYWAIVESGGGRTLLFASELRSLLATGLIPRRIDPTALSSYLWHGFVVGDRSLIAGVRSMPAGTTATVALDKISFRPSRYWQLPSARSDVPPRKQHNTRRVEPLEHLSVTLHEAVRLQLASDVPLGVFLSGGIDSSAVASLAVRAGAGDVRTFNIGFDEAEFDESRHARAVARALGTRHEEIRLDARSFQDGLHDALASLDQPSFDAINTYFVSRAVRRAGITVALAGTGGDELFGGYKSFVDVPRARGWARRLSPLPESVVRVLASAVARAKGSRGGLVAPQTRWGKLGDALATRGERTALYQVSYGLYTQSFLRELAGDELSELAPYGMEGARFDELEHLVRDGDERVAVSILELASFVGQRLLRDGDAASMASSLELRVPLLDAYVVEAASAIPPAQRFEPLGRKQLLRDIALQDLDPALFERPKSGFVLPFERWCRDTLKDEVGALLEDADACASVGLDPDVVARLWQAFQAEAPGIYWSRIWSLYVLLVWCRTHDVVLEPASVAR